MSDRRDSQFRVDALADLRAQFVNALESQTETPAVAPARARTWRIRRRPAWAGALIVTAAVAVVAFLLLQGGTVQSVQQATASVADTALQAPYPPDDWYTYAEETTTHREYVSRRVGADRSFIGPGHTQRVISRSWASVSRYGVSIARVVSSPSEPIYTRLRPFYKYEIGNDRYTRDEIEAFANDPQPLIDKLNADAEAQRPGYKALTKWDEITYALRGNGAPLPPAVRSALIRELATIPGVRVADSDTDPLGRPAIGLYLEYQQLRDTVYFEKSSAVLSWQGKMVLVDGFGYDPDLKKGDYYETYAELEHRAVPELPPVAKKALSQAESPD